MIVCRPTLFQKWLKATPSLRSCSCQGGALARPSIKRHCRKEGNCQTASDCCHLLSGAAFVPGPCSPGCYKRMGWADEGWRRGRSWPMPAVIGSLSSRFNLARTLSGFHPDGSSPYSSPLPSRSLFTGVRLPVVRRPSPPVATPPPLSSTGVPHIGVLQVKFHFGVCFSENLSWHKNHLQCKKSKVCWMLDSW